MSEQLDNLMANFDQLSAKAEEDADVQTAEKISEITSMTQEEVSRLFPKHSDQKKLVELMKIVKSADDHNTKINTIVERAEDFGGVIVKLLRTFL